MRWLEEALTHAQEKEGGERLDAAARFRALVALGPLRALRADFERARTLLGEALALAQQRQDPVTTAEALTQLGFRAILAGELAEATRLLGEARRHWETLGAPHGLGLTLQFLGLAADSAEDVVVAAAYYTAALQQLDAVGDARLAGLVHCSLGVADWRRGEAPSAVEHVRAAVRIGVTLQDRWLLCFAAQAAVALVAGRAEPAQWVSLLGAADALAQATGATVAWWWERLSGGREVVRLRERLTQGEEEDELAAAYREGRALSFGEIAALALRLLGGAPKRSPAPKLRPRPPMKRSGRLPYARTR